MGIYSHVLDQWGIIYDQPLVLHQRQAGAALEGVVRQTAVANVERLAVDTHGYTDFGMGIGKLLGVDLCPRLSHLRDRRLHVPRMDHALRHDQRALTNVDRQQQLADRIDRTPDPVRRAG
jgi:TnpA family transposase